MLICISTTARPPAASYMELNQKAAEYNKIIAIAEYQKYYWKMAQAESSMVWDTINSRGYFGLFQFGESTLHDLGHKISCNQFRSDPNIFTPSMQFEAMDSLTRRNERQLKDVIERNSGKVIDGIVVSKWSILAASHLGGVTGTRNYFEKGLNKSDGRTTIEDYIKKFAK
jgi:hypothetical protein